MIAALVAVTTAPFVALIVALALGGAGVCVWLDRCERIARERSAARLRHPAGKALRSDDVAAPERRAVE